MQAADLYAIKSSVPEREMLLLVTLGGMRLRVGLTGAQGVGKTTLANALAGVLGWPMIEEQARAVFRKGELWDKCSFAGKPKESSAFQWRCLEEQLRLENELEHFIADRTVIDNAAYWVRWRMANSSSRESLAYYRRCEDQAKLYDLVVYVRPELAPVANGFRSTDRDYQLEMDWLIRTLMYGLIPPGRVLEVSGTIEERIDAIMKRLSNRAGDMDLTTVYRRNHHPSETNQGYPQ